MTRIFDIDLDVFVFPPAFHRRKGDSRLPSDEYHVPDLAQIAETLAKWKIDAATPLQCLEHHDEILDAVAALIEKGTIKPPFCWLGFDAHDDFWGHYSRPSDFNNYMYELIRRGWAGAIGWICPEGYLDLPDYVYDWQKQEIRFEEHSTPIRTFTLEEFTVNMGPDFAFLARSPSYTPIEADTIFDFIRDHTANVDSTITQRVWNREKIPKRRVLQ